MRLFRWITDAWLRFIRRLGERQNYVALLDQRDERHRREIEFLKSVIELDAIEKKGLLAIIQTLRAEQDKTMAVLGRETAEAQYSTRRIGSAGGAIGQQ